MTHRERREFLQTIGVKALLTPFETDKFLVDLGVVDDEEFEVGKKGLDLLVDEDGHTYYFDITNLVEEGFKKINVPYILANAPVFRIGEESYATRCKKLQTLWSDNLVDKLMESKNDLTAVDAFGVPIAEEMALFLKRNSATARSIGLLEVRTSPPLLDLQNGKFVRHDKRGILIRYAFIGRWINLESSNALGSARVTNYE